MSSIKSSELKRLADLLEVLELFGIQDSCLKLHEERVTPKACLTEAYMHFDLLAYQGNKWCNELWLDAQLERMRLKDGTVRFLLSTTTSDENKERLMELSSKFSNTFYVKFFNERSLFRCIFIDNAKMIFTHYGYEVIDQEGINAKGWESPQLIVDMKANWSLAIPLRQYFNDLWAKSKSIEELKGKKIKAEKTQRREFK